MRSKRNIILSPFTIYLELHEHADVNRTLCFKVSWCNFTMAISIFYLFGYVFGTETHNRSLFNK
jgi:hypothetical protein